MFDIGSSLREADSPGARFPRARGADEDPSEVPPGARGRALRPPPAPTYVRGFLSSYAEALGLDGQPFVDEYNSRFTVGEDDAPLRARRVPPPRHVRGPRESRIAAVALAAIAIVAALVIAAWKFGGPERREGGRTPVRSGRTAAATPRPKGTARLVVRASDGSSWMEVRETSTAGKLLYSGTLEGGQRKEFEGKSLQLALAKPHNVVVRLNGNRVDSRRERRSS